MRQKNRVLGSVLLFLLCAGIFSFLLNEAVVPVQATGSDDWPMFHHDVAHTGYSTSVAPTSDLVWTYTCNGWVDSGPAVANGVLYVGSNDHNLTAIDARTGARIWNYTTGGVITNSFPAIDSGYVYVGSRDKNVYGLNAATGAKIWNYTTGGFVESSPTVVSGIVYVGSSDYNVYALNAATGAKIWNYTTGDAVASCPAVVGGVVYVGAGDYNVYALNAATGAKIWNYTTGDVLCSPAVIGSILYVGSGDHRIYALNCSTGAQIWNYTTGNGIHTSSPAVAGGILYVGSYDTKLYALNATNGALNWTYTTGNVITSSPAVAGGVVYVGSTDNKVYAINATSGVLKWNYTTGNQIYGPPSIVNGVLYIGSDDNKVYALGVYLDTSPPTYSNISTNSTVWGTACNFSILINDDVALQTAGTYIFGCNNTGPFLNDSSGVAFTSTPQWVNVTKTLNSTNSNATHPEIIQYEWWFTDNAGNQNNSGLKTLTLSWHLSIGWNNVTIFSFDVGYTLGGINASLNYDGILWTDIVYQNSSTSAQYVFHNGLSVNGLIVIYHSTGIILIFCTTAAEWTHTYPLQGGVYGSDPTALIVGAAIVAIAGVGVWIYRKLRKKKVK